MITTSPDMTLVGVARDEARLQERATDLRAAHGVKVEVLAADLVNRTDLAVVETRLAASGADRVTTLVNNAGFGLLKLFDENQVDDEQQLLDLLVTAPMRLAHAAFGQVHNSGSGTTVTIASVAGFTPRGSYGASKAWILSFRRWANLSYRGRGIARALRSIEQSPDSCRSWDAWLRDCRCLAY